MYYFYLDKILLPVVPSKLQLKISNKNKTMTLIDTGEINILKTPGLTDISFEVLLPHREYPFTVYKNGFISIDSFLSIFEKLKVDKKPFNFIVSRFKPSGELMFDTNIKVSLEEYTITEESSEGLDTLVNIKLKQYREYIAKRLEVEQNNSSEADEMSVTNERPKKETTNTYTVVKGDNLWSICKKYLGDGSKYKEIAKLNNISNPNLIYPGQVIRFE